MLFRHVVLKLKYARVNEAWAQAAQTDFIFVGIKF